MDRRCAGERKHQSPAPDAKVSVWSVWMRRTKGIDFRSVVRVGGLAVVAAILIAWPGRRDDVASARRSPLPAGRLAAPGSTPDQQIAFYQARLADHPRDAESWNTLAVGYMRKLRESGDPGYALRAEASLRQTLRVEPRDPDAPALLAWVALVKHDFASARLQAGRLLRQTPDDDRLYGIQGDAEIELGLYRDARETFQRMVDLKPGLAAYTRIAYLRELHGDVPGAIEMMRLALEAASPRDHEGLAWTRVQFGNLYLAHGNLAAAEDQYSAALRTFPGYLYALAGLGNVRAAEGRFDDAIHLYERSLAVIPLPETAATAGDVYLRAGRRGDAERLYALVEYIGKLTELNQVVYNRELAFFYADHDRHVDRAVALAEREAARRHDIYTTDTLAWAYSKAGRNDEADALLRRALALGARDARLFYHAGVIAWKQGNLPRAVHYLTQALRTNPHFHVLHADEARRLLETLSR